MADWDMPLEAASLLKASSKGSKAPELRQFAGARGALGAPRRSAARTAQAGRIVRIIMLCLCPRRLMPNILCPSRVLRLWHCLLAERQLAYPDRGAAADHAP